MTTNKEAIRTHALELGFDACGFAPASTPDDAKMDLRMFVNQGLHGDMNWMPDTLERRVDPQVLWRDARSVIVLGMNYGPIGSPSPSPAQPNTQGAISTYAQGRDYHDVVKKRLKRLARWLVEQWDCDVKVFVDTAPVMEKVLAAQSGIGWTGKHTNIVSRDFGSWLFLGEVFTTLDIEPDRPEPDHCGNCTACVDACPTDALSLDRKIDATKCVSYLTIETKAAVPDALKEKLGNRIYGCDDCMAVCPWNKFAKPMTEMAFAPRPELAQAVLSDWATLDDPSFRAMLTGSPVKRTGRDRMVRNVLTAMGNSGNKAYGPIAEKLTEDASEQVAEAAKWAVQKLKARDA